MSGVIELDLSFEEVCRIVNKEEWSEACPHEAKVNAACYRHLQLAGVPVYITDMYFLRFGVRSGMLEKHYDRITKAHSFRWTPGVTSAAEPDS